MDAIAKGHGDPAVLGPRSTALHEERERIVAACESEPPPTEGMDFADALHLGKPAHCEGFATFDRKFVKAAKAAGHEGVREA